MPETISEVALFLFSILESLPRASLQLPYTQMANWYYYNESGEKIGPISSTVLKELARQGLVTKETKIENINGRAALAGSVNGLTFPEAKPSELETVPLVGTNVYDFASPSFPPPPTGGFDFPDLVSEEQTPEGYDPFANTVPVAPPVQTQSPFTKPIVIVPVSIFAGMLLILPFIFLSGINQSKPTSENNEHKVIEKESISNSKHVQNAPADIISTMKKAQKAFDECMASIADSWKMMVRAAPNLPTGYHRSSAAEVALDVGLYEGLDQYMETLRKDVKKLNKNKYPNTLKLFAILSQYENSVKTLDGS
ncbi:MAG: DUF4339 domain-containing protein, partial [Planctomycetaceae bacterium]|nr:DUF4339 domain-containing protein [Planctomycetaceae bacterium]